MRCTASTATLVVSNIFFIFTPTWGKMNPFWPSIFQMGWNHQLGVLFACKGCYTASSALAGHSCNGATHRILPGTNIAHCPDPVPGGVPFQNRKTSHFTSQTSLSYNLVLCSFGLWKGKLFMTFIQDGVLSYILAPLTLRPGDQAHDVVFLIPQSPTIFQDVWLQVIASEAANIVPGNCLPLRLETPKHEKSTSHSWGNYLCIGIFQLVPSSTTSNYDPAGLSDGKWWEDGEHMTGKHGDESCQSGI